MRTPIQTILCATDFSRHGTEVIRYAATLSRCLGAHLRVFHAVCHGGPPGTAALRHPSESTHSGKTEQIRQQVQTILADRHADWEVLVRFGDPVGEIIELTRSERVDLVIAASYGLPGWKRLLLGTVVESMAAVLDIPLWVTPPNAAEPAPPKEVLVACELTDDDFRLYELALPLAETLRSRIHWVNVAESPIYPEMIEPDSGPYGEAQQILQDRLRQQLIERRPEPPHGKDDSRTAVLTGNAGEALMSYSRRHHVDLIVAGVHRKPSGTKNQISTTALALLRRAPCAVLAIPMGAVDEFAFRRRRYGRQKRSRTS